MPENRELHRMMMENFWANQSILKDTLKRKCANNASVISLALHEKLIRIEPSQGGELKYYRTEKGKKYLGL